MPNTPPTLSEEERIRLYEEFAYLGEYVLNATHWRRDDDGNILPQDTRNELVKLSDFIAASNERARMKERERISRLKEKVIENTLDSLNGCGIDPGSHPWKLVENWLHNMWFFLESDLEESNA